MRRFRPALEALEWRDVPAIWTDASGDHSASNPANWLSGSLPQAGDVLYFSGGYTSDDCVGLAGLTYWGLLFDGGYAGTVTAQSGFGAGIVSLAVGSLDVQGAANITTAQVTGGSLLVEGAATIGTLSLSGGAAMVGGPVTAGSLSVSDGTATLTSGGTVGSATVSGGTVGLGGQGGGFSFGTFQLLGGEILQAAAADMTVTQEVNWTAGDINAAGNAAKLIISGATGTIAPDNAGSVAIGSTLNIVNGASVTFDVGTISFEGGEGVKVENAKAELVTADDKYEQAKLDWKAGQGGGVVPGPLLLLAEGSDYHLVRRSTTKIGEWHTNFPIVNNGGTLRVDGAIAVFVDGRLPGNGPSIKQYPTSSIQISGGSGITVPYGIVISGGTFEASWTKQSGELVTVVGNMLVNDKSAGVIGFNTNGYGTILVQGNVTWSAGNYSPGVDGATPGRSDRWKATGTFTVGLDARLAPHVNNDESAQSGWTWIILDTANTGQIEGDPPPLRPDWTPAVDKNYTVDTSGEPPVRYWLLQRK